MQPSPKFFLTAFVLLLPLGCPSDDGNADTSSTSGNDEIETSADTSSDATNDTNDTSDTNADGGFCIHQCMADADCLVDGQDVGLTCQDSLCTGDSSGCTDNAECVAVFSGWTMPCTAGGGECDQLMQICVAAGDGGLCATPPSDFFMCDVVPGWSEIEVPDIDGNLVTVCGNASAECNEQGFCYSPCQSDADCTSEAYPVCDTNSGLCGCSSDTDCATLGQPQASVCNAGVCGCGSDQHCVDGNAGDVCSDGACGCSGDAACANVENAFDGGMISCVAL
jgi:hypothetical protein